MQHKTYLIFVLHTFTILIQNLNAGIIENWTFGLVSYVPPIQITQIFTVFLMAFEKQKIFNYLDNFLPFEYQTT